MIKFLLNHIPNILNLVFIPLAACYLFHTFSKIKNKRTLFLTIVIFSITYCFVNSFVNIMPFRFILTFACVLILSLGFMIKTSYRLLLSGVLLALLGISDVLAVMSQLLFFNISTEKTYTEPYYSLGVLQTFIIIFTILFLIHHTKHHRFVNVHSKKIWILYSLPLATVLAIWIEYAIVCSFELSTRFELLLIANAFVLILTNFIVFYFSDNMYEKLEYEYKLRIAEEMISKQRQKYFSLVEGNAEIKQIKHDQRNFILGAITDLKQNKYETLEKHLSKQLETLEKFNYDNPDNQIFDIIIESKQIEAEKQGITIFRDIHSLSILQIDSIDFAIIIGNLLDNAIEATTKIKELKSKTIEAFIEVNNTHVLISITNSVDKDINVDQLATTKSDTTNHGFGLLSVHKIVDKYKGSFILKCHDGIFEASIMLPQSSSL